MDRIALNQVESYVADLPYPVARNDAAAAYDDVTVVFAEGEGNLGSLIDDCYCDTFYGADDLFAELNNALPIGAVGEPGQSDGDA